MLRRIAITGAAIGAACLLFVGQGLMAQTGEKSGARSGAQVTPTIHIDPLKDGVRIEAAVLGHDSLPVRAVLTIARTSQSGSVNTSQAREIHLEPGLREVVATSALSMGTDARLIVTLVIESEGREIARVEQSRAAN